MKSKINDYLINEANNVGLDIQKLEYLKELYPQINRYMFEKDITNSYSKEIPGENEFLKMQRTRILYESIDIFLDQMKKDKTFLKKYLFLTKEWLLNSDYDLTRNDTVLSLCEKHFTDKTFQESLVEGKEILSSVRNILYLMMKSRLTKINGVTKITDITIGEIRQLFGGQENLLDISPHVVYVMILIHAYLYCYFLETSEKLQMQKIPKKQIIPLEIDDFDDESKTVLQNQPIIDN